MREAAASLAKAIATNPLLQREYGAALAEARLEGGLTKTRPVRL
jgi:hypothetical protein